MADDSCYDVRQWRILSLFSAKVFRITASWKNWQKAKLNNGGTSDPEAYQLCLKGRFYWDKRTPDALNKSRDYFQQAVDKDPNYALAYVGLAE